MLCVSFSFPLFSRSIANLARGMMMMTRKGQKKFRCLLSSLPRKKSEIDERGLWYFELWKGRPRDICATIEFSLQLRRKYREYTRERKVENELKKPMTSDERGHNNHAIKKRTLDISWCFCPGCQSCQWPARTMQSVKRASEGGIVCIRGKDKDRKISAL